MGYRFLLQGHFFRQNPIASLRNPAEITLNPIIRFFLIREKLITTGMRPTAAAV